MESLHRSLSIDAQPTPFVMWPDQTAVVVMDMQNAFASEGGAFARGGRNIELIQATAKTTKLLEPVGSD